jgi:hypothetical protein
MTVAELIAALQGFPPDLIVLVDGYEMGMYAASPPRLVDAIGPDEEPPSFFGEYLEPADRNMATIPTLPDVRAVLISRREK